MQTAKIITKFPHIGNDKYRRRQQFSLINATTFVKQKIDLVLLIKVHIKSNYRLSSPPGVMVTLQQWKSKTNFLHKAKNRQKRGCDGSHPFAHCGTAHVIFNNGI